MPLRLPTPVLVALIALAVAVLLDLGVWQVQRNEEKQRLVAERNASLAAAPLPAAEALREPPEALDYRLVGAQGTWDHGHAMVLANRARFSTKGEELVVPLLLAAGGPAILVNRGWYEASQRDRVLAEVASSDAAATQGLARYVEGLEARRTPAGTWTGLSPRDMAAGLPYEVAPWFLVEGELLAPDAGRPRTLLAQGFFAYRSTTPHMEYALTWFGIAAALVTIAVIRFVVAPRRTRAAEAVATAERSNEGGSVR